MSLYYPDFALNDVYLFADFKKKMVIGNIFELKNRMIVDTEVLREIPKFFFEYIFGVHKK